MGAITTAVSQNGMKYFLSTPSMIDTIKNCLAGQTINHDKISNLNIPVGLTTSIVDMEINMYNGTTSSVSVVWDNSAFTQSDNGKFSLGFTASFDVKYEKWHEEGTRLKTTTSIPVKTPFDQDCKDQFHFHVDLEYHIDLVLSISDGNFVFQVKKVTQQDIEESDIHIPDDSEISGIEDTSFLKDIRDNINKHFVDEIDFSSAVKSALNPKLASIPNSGHLTDNIIFFFAPDQIAFPKDGDGNYYTQSSVSGQVTYKGQPYPGELPSVPPMPDNIPDKHVHLNVTDYVFNGLFWGFYNDGLLELEVVKSMLADPQELNTNYYRDTFPPIYKFAPNCDMTVDVAAIQAPAQQNQAAYEITDTTIQNLTGKVPDDVLKTLAADMEGLIYIDIDDFNSDLNTYLGADNFKLYGNLIDIQAQTIASVVRHSMSFDVYALMPDSGGNTQKTFMFECNVSQTDYLNDYVLGNQADVQTLKFYFNLHDANATLVKSNVPGLTTQYDFNMLWSFIIRPEMAKTIQKMGDNGVPLPSVKGFLFENATVDLFEGYTSIASDINIG
ncbi:MAG TPA: hypothetical protein PKA28_03905 [Methylomusa anaerophila]|uniref:Uncharacterized protein n=1 Tax=Methylomusa anaerophila TaxID=1930071 RepID=A0A348ANC5_9FIRM|nr:hypothetical protein [Methylomusa anaerophila]BBB92573.1 hypothetical protein MAMMFC1_03268 [Methylomusa anaerophila]HML87573.1 hypothetical protein [Methylomusa anaerophila]